MKIYVASSWRNPSQPQLIRDLRAEGHEVYDFREPTPGGRGFSWHELDSRIPVGPAALRLAAEDIRGMLRHPIAEAGFALDMGALRWCDTCVLLLPSGRSAHLEAGWACGAGKLTIGLLADGEPDLMWKMLDYLCVTIEEVIDVLRGDMFTIGSQSAAEAEVGMNLRDAASNDPELGWALSPDTGISSLTILLTLGSSPFARAAALGKLGSLRPDRPHDPADLGRCVRLLDRFPAWRERLRDVARQYPAWSPLIQHWSELGALYREELAENSGYARRTYARMRELEAGL